MRVCKLASTGFNCFAIFRTDLWGAQTFLFGYVNWLTLINTTGVQKKEEKPFERAGTKLETFCYWREQWLMALEARRKNSHIITDRLNQLFNLFFLQLHPSLSAFNWSYFSLISFNQAKTVNEKSSCKVVVPFFQLVISNLYLFA